MQSSGAPTVYDVAERAGVSIATVSRAYRTPDAVRPATRERVLAVARSLGYVPSGSARAMASRATGVLGLCFPDFTEPKGADGPDGGDGGGADGSGGSGGGAGGGADLSGAGVGRFRVEPAHEGDAVDDDVDEAGGGAMLYSDLIIRGMEVAARRHGYALLIASQLIAASLAEGPESVVAKVAGRVDGFAVLAGTVPTDDLEVVSHRLPVVMLAGPRGFDHLDHVVVANEDGQFELTRHLIEDHGLRRTAFIGGPVLSPDVEARFRGYAAALARAGLPVPDAPDVRGDLTRASGRAAAERLLAAGGRLGPPEAMVFANDQMALGGLQALERHGLRVPEDVAVTGFDGTTLGLMSRPTLTTVRQPTLRVGEEAVELLVRRLAERGRPPEALTLPVRVVLRRSCGCGG